MQVSLALSAIIIEVLAGGGVKGEAGFSPLNFELSENCRHKFFRPEIFVQKCTIWR